MKKIVMIIICSLLLYGCAFIECYPVVKGFILDDKTNQPIEGALIKLDDEKILSGNNGFFLIASSSCDKKIVVTKDGYKPFVIEIYNKYERINITLVNQSDDKVLEKPEILKDSNSYIISKSIDLNSTKFEYGDTLKIFLSRVH